MFSLKTLHRIKGSGKKIAYLMDLFVEKNPQFTLVEGIHQHAHNNHTEHEWVLGDLTVFRIFEKNGTIKSIEYPRNFKEGDTMMTTITISLSNNGNLSGVSFTEASITTGVASNIKRKEYVRDNHFSYMTTVVNGHFRKRYKYQKVCGVKKRYIMDIENKQIMGKRMYIERYGTDNNKFTCWSTGSGIKDRVHEFFGKEDRFHVALSEDITLTIPQIHIDKAIARREFKHRSAYKHLQDEGDANRKLGTNS